MSNVFDLHKIRIQIIYTPDSDVAKIIIIDDVIEACLLQNRLFRIQLTIENWRRDNKFDRQISLFVIIIYRRRTTYVCDFLLISVQKNKYPWRKYVLNYLKKNDILFNIIGSFAI